VNKAFPHSALARHNMVIWEPAWWSEVWALAWPD